MARLVRLVTNTSTSTPAATASSTAYWMMGLSTTDSISFGEALVAGRKRVPRPATGNTALRTRGMDMGFCLFLHHRLGVQALAGSGQDHLVERHGAVPGLAGGALPVEGAAAEAAFLAPVTRPRFHEVAHRHAQRLDVRGCGLAVTSGQGQVHLIQALQGRFGAQVLVDT